MTQKLTIAAAIPVLRKAIAKRKLGYQRPKIRNKCSCAYDYAHLGFAGTRCAVGALMSADTLRRIKRHDLNMADVSMIVGEFAVEIPAEEMWFFREIQDVHDRAVKPHPSKTTSEVTKSLKSVIARGERFINGDKEASNA